MQKGRTRGSRLSTVSSILMIILGAFAITEVDFVLGVVLLVLGVGMFLFDRRIRGLRKGGAEEHGAKSPEKSERPPAS